MSLSKLLINKIDIDQSSVSKPTKAMPQKIFGQQSIGQKIIRIGLAASLLLAPNFAQALSLGKLRVDSNIGQPLKLQITVDSLTEEEANTLVVSLASRSDFLRADVEYPTIAEILQFELVEEDNGNYRVIVTTQNPIEDTFLHLLISANWSGGKSVREYTALLDPPLYSGQTGADITVAGQSATSAEVESAVSGYAGQGSTSAGEVVIGRGDTLSEIVNQIEKPLGVDHYQGLLATFRKNPHAFVDNNMNLLRKGVKLTLPTFEEMLAVTRSESIQSFQTQLAKFNDFRNETRIKQEEDSSELLNELIDQSAVAAVDESGENTELSAEIEAQLQSEEESEARLTIGQDVDGTALEGVSGNAAQLSALNAQLAELEESLLASGVENQAVSQNFKRIQDQVARLSGLVEIEDSNLANTQNRIVQQGIDENQGATQSGQSIVASLGGESSEAVNSDASSSSASGLNNLVGSGNNSLAGVDSESVNPEGSVEEDIANEQQLVNSQSAETTVTPAVGAESNAEQLVAANIPATQNNLAETSIVKPAGEDEEQAALPVAGVAQTTGSGQEGNGNAVGDTVRRIAESSLIDSFRSVFSFIPDYGLKILAGLMVLLGGLFVWQRHQSRKEFDEGMMDIETEDASMNSEMSIQRMSESTGIDLASANDSALELTIGGGMSYLSEEGVTGVTEEENEVIKAGAVDPLAEADVYLAYDRDEQAIQVLKEAYADSPERGELAEKLLDIYHKQDDRRAFDAVAAELHRRRDTTQNFNWDRIATMGKEVSPENALYRGELAPSDNSSSVLNLNEEVVSDIVPGIASNSELSIESSDLELDDILKQDSQNTAVRSLEIDDIEIDALKIDEEGLKLEKSLDAPTLSQIINRNIDSNFELKDDDNEPEITLGANDLDDLVNDDPDFKLLDDEADDIAEKLKSTALEVDKLSESQAIDLDSSMSDMSDSSISKLEPYHESETALELAKAYLELGEQDIAKGFIEEVLSDGSDKQKGKARKLIKELAT